VVFSRKYIALNAYVRKKERSQINELSFDLRNQERKSTLSQEQIKAEGNNK
jgi:hypothetical protein